MSGDASSAGGRRRTPRLGVLVPRPRVAPGRRATVTTGREPQGPRPSPRDRPHRGAMAAQGAPPAERARGRGRPAREAPARRPAPKATPPLRETRLTGQFPFHFRKRRLPVALAPRGRPLATTSSARMAGSLCDSGARLAHRDSGSLRPRGTERSERLGPALRLGRGIRPARGKERAGGAALPPLLRADGRVDLLAARLDLEKHALRVLQQGGDAIGHLPLIRGPQLLDVRPQ